MTWSQELKEKRTILDDIGYCDPAVDGFIHSKLDGRFQKFFKMIEYCCIWSHPFDYFCEIRVILRSVTATDVNSNKDIFER